jgi:hypothetical protein
MPTFTVTDELITPFPGQAANVRYTVTDAGGTPRVIFPNAVVTEAADFAGALNTGAYVIRFTADTGWAWPLAVLYTIQGIAGVGVPSTIGLPAAVMMALGYGATRAAKLDNLDVPVSTLSTYAGGDTPGTTTLLGRLPGIVQPQTGDVFARLGAPVGTSIAADIQTRSIAGGSVASVLGDIGGKVLGGGAGTIVGDGVRSAAVTGAVGGSVGSVVAPVTLPTPVPTGYGGPSIPLGEGVVSASPSAPTRTQFTITGVALFDSLGNPATPASGEWVGGFAYRSKVAGRRRIQNHTVVGTGPSALHTLTFGGGVFLDAAFGSDPTVGEKVEIG